MQVIITVTYGLDAEFTYRPAEVSVDLSEHAAGHLDVRMQAVADGAHLATVVLNRVQAMDLLLALAGLIPQVKL
jgi:hypothetical protein